MVHPGQVQKWKGEALSNFENLFGRNLLKERKPEEQIEVLERKIGQLTIENDFLKKDGWDMFEREAGNDRDFL